MTQVVVRWTVVLMPLGIGALVALLFFSGLLTAPLVYLKADAGTLCLICGAVVTGVTGIALAVWTVLDKRHRLRLARVRNNAAAERQRFLKRLDHELKNPLTAAQIALANLGDAKAPEAALESLHNMRAQIQRISRLTADLRKLAELETRPIEQAQVDLSVLLQQTVELAQDRPEAADRLLTLTLPTAPWPLPKITGDPDLLLLAAHNLIDNALKYSRPGDAIEVRAHEDSRWITIEIADTGPGISEADMPHIWDELYRSQEARAVSGSGLGLSLVSMIVQRHGGQISGRSRAGYGTVFTVRLPVNSSG
jgi:two-component system OmpR family sensor kinase